MQACDQHQHDIEQNHLHILFSQHTIEEMVAHIGKKYYHTSKTTYTWEKYKMTVVDALHTPDMLIFVLQVTLHSEQQRINNKQQFVMVTGIGLKGWN